MARRNQKSEMYSGMVNSWKRTAAVWRRRLSGIFRGATRILYSVGSARWKGGRGTAYLRRLGLCPGEDGVLFGDFGGSAMSSDEVEVFTARLSPRHLPNSGLATPLAYSRSMMDGDVSSSAKRARAEHPPSSPSSEEGCDDGMLCVYYISLCVYICVYISVYIGITCNQQYWAQRSTCHMGDW